MSLALRAKQFATEAHNSIAQKRKYTGEPYIVHPEDVVAILTRLSDKPPTEEMIAAAWLHDVVEDTPVTLDDVRAKFGSKVADLVDQVTDRSRPEHGSRAVRKAIDRSHIACGTPEAKSIKLADLISNSASITQYDPLFAKVYMAEKRELLKVLGAGDVGLLKLATYIVDKYFMEQALAA